MIIKPVSDLHLDSRMVSFDKQFAEHIDVAGLVNQTIDMFDDYDTVDVLVLAGDIWQRWDSDASLDTHWNHVETVLKGFAEVYKYVIYVGGNHEHWTMLPEQVTPGIKSILKGIPNAYYLDNEVVTIDGKRFLGGTSWYNMDPAYSKAFSLRFRFSDFQAIYGGFPTWVGRKHREFMDFLKQELQAGDVVVSHHAPHHRSSDPQFVGNEFSCFYINNMPNWVWEREAALWIHGHIHHASYYTVNRTSVVCNPLGHTHQLHTGFKKNLTVAIE